MMVAGVEARHCAGGAPHALALEQRDRRALDRRQVVHEIVERLERAGVCVTQHLAEPAFGLAGEDRDAERLRVLQRLVVAVEHGDHTRHVETADADLDALRAQRPRQIERARPLVRLHADHHDHAGVGGLDQSGDVVDADAAVGLVDGMNVDVGIGTEHLLVNEFLGDAVDRRKRIRRDRRAVPLDDIAVVVVMRRLDQDETEPASLSPTGHVHPPSRPRWPSPYRRRSKNYTDFGRLSAAGFGGKTGRNTRAGR
jgi:hypothetical protein